MARVPPEPRCISCGYSLAGLSREALCPECAFPVARSLDATPLLRTAEPRWLGVLERGPRLWKQGGHLCMAIIGLIAGVLVLVTILRETSTGLPDWLDPARSSTALKVIAVVFWAAALAPVVCGVAGIWMLTAPTVGPQAPLARLRLIARWGAAACVVLTAAGWAVSARYGLPLIAALAVRAVIQIVGLASMYSFARVLVHLERGCAACRLDLPKRVKNTTNGIGVVAVLFVFGWIGVWGPGWRTASPTIGGSPIAIFLVFACFGSAVRHLGFCIGQERAAANAALAGRTTARINN